MPLSQHEEINRQDKLVPLQYMSTAMPDGKSILKAGNFECRVSSVLNKNVREFGKKHMFDNNEETCWNSDQGSPQWIAFHFTEEIKVGSMQIQFQGGFVGKDCWIEHASEPNSWQKSETFYPEDVNSLQKFTLENPVMTKYLRLVLNSSTDFFGRIVVYKLDLLGVT